MSRKQRHGDPNTLVILTVATALAVLAGLSGAALGVLSGAL